MPAPWSLDAGARRRISGVALAASIVQAVLVGWSLTWPLHPRHRGLGFVLGDWVAMLVRTLFLQSGLAALVLAGLGLVGAQKIRALLAGAVAVACLAPSVLTLVPHSRPGPTSERPLRIVTINLLASNPQKATVVRQLAAIDADVVVAQEVTVAWDEALRTGLVDRYPNVVSVPRPDSFGVAVLSRRPFVGRPDVAVALGPVDAPQVRAVIDAGGFGLAVYDVHLAPPTSLSNVRDHRRQLADLRDRLGAETFPYIVAGDLNLGGEAPQLRVLRGAGAHDAFDQAGRGLGWTWPADGIIGRIAPGLRLDHLLLSGDLAAMKAFVAGRNGSDHRPLVAEVRRR